MFNKLSFNGHNKIFHNSLWLVFDKFFSLGLGFITTMIVARQLGVDLFGKFSYITAYIALWTPLFSLGIAKILLREFATTPDKIATNLITARNVRLISTALFSIPALAIFSFSDESRDGIIPIVILLFGNLTHCLEVYDFWFQHRSQNKFVVKLRVLNTLVFSILKIALVYYTPSLTYLVALIALEWLSLKLGYYFIFRHYAAPWDVAGHFELSAFRNLFQQSKYLIFSGIAAVIYLKIDIIMLEKMTNSGVVGQYSVAAKLSEVWFVIPTVIVTALSPQMIQWWQNTPQKYYQRCQEFFSLLFWIALIIAVFTYTLAPYFVPLLFGEQYGESVDILRLHVWALLFISMRLLFSHVLVLLSLAKFSLVSQLSGAIMNVVLNLVLIPKYQAKGAAIATLVSYATSSYLCLLLSPQTWRYFVMMSKAVWPGYVVNLLFKKPHQAPG